MKKWPTLKLVGKKFDAKRMNTLPKFVASRTLAQAEWNATLIRGNIAEEVAKLKQHPGRDLLVVGSGDLVQTLIQHDLIDEYRIWVHPVVLGCGQRLFREGSEKIALSLVDTKTTSTGAVILTYRPVGETP